MSHLGTTGGGGYVRQCIYGAGRICPKRLFLVLSVCTVTTLETYRNEMSSPLVFIRGPYFNTFCPEFQNGVSDYGIRCQAGRPISA